LEGTLEHSVVPLALWISSSLLGLIAENGTLSPLTDLHIMKEGKRDATDGHGNGQPERLVSSRLEKRRWYPRRGQREKVTPTWAIVPGGRPDQTEIRGMGGAATADPFGAREERVIRPLDSGNR
jgi:hypothetical protein